MKIFKKTHHCTMNTLTIPYLILVAAALLSACGGSDSTKNENTVAASLVPQGSEAKEKYVIDNKQSEVTWKCSMVISSKGGHNGYISLSKGELMMDKGQLVGGIIDVDMNTIADEKKRSDNDLVEHLKSADFFDVGKFPTSRFAITKVTSASGGNVNITGILTIKGIMQTVTFPAKVEVKDGLITANGKVTIDRTQWDVRYKSGVFYANLADEAISDNIEFEMKIVAKK